MADGARSAACFDSGSAGKSGPSECATGITAIASLGLNAGWTNVEFQPIRTLVSVPREQRESEVGDGPAHVWRLRGHLLAIL